MLTNVEEILLNARDFCSEGYTILKSDPNQQYGSYAHCWYRTHMSDPYPNEM